MKKWFSTQYRIIPVYAESSNKQVAVMVEVKHNFMQEFYPMAKTCLSENGELVEKPAIFDDNDSAMIFITCLTTKV